MIPPEFRNYNDGGFMKYLTLPTWMTLQLLISGMPDHPYNQWYPTLEDWAVDSPLLYRLVDLALILVTGSFICNIASTFF